MAPASRLGSAWEVGASAACLTWAGWGKTWDCLCQRCPRGRPGSQRGEMVVSFLLWDPWLSQLPAAARGHVMEGAGPSGSPTDFNRVDVRAITAAAFPL